MKAKIIVGSAVLALVLVVVAILIFGKGTQATPTSASTTYPASVGVSGTIKAISGNTLSVEVSTGNPVQVLMNGATLVVDGSFTSPFVLRVGDKVIVDPVASPASTGSSTGNSSILLPGSPQRAKTPIALPTSSGTGGGITAGSGRAGGSSQKPQSGGKATGPASPNGSALGERAATPTSQPSEPQRPGELLPAHLIWVIAAGRTLTFGVVQSVAGNTIKLKSATSTFEITLGSKTTYRVSAGAGSASHTGSSADVQVGKSLWVLGAPGSTSASPLDALSVLVQPTP